MTKHFIGWILILLSTHTYSQPEARVKIFPRKVEYVEKMPAPEKVWIFIMAGQSNMAGRGFIEPEDTTISQRVITLTKDKRWAYAKEPLHFYENDRLGLDCGLSFGKELLTRVKDSITIALIPCAVGGSSIQQWLGDSLHRNLNLMTNFKERVDFAKKYGTIKGILWHQGESDGHAKLVAAYEKKLERVINIFRAHIGDRSLPVLIGDLASFAQTKEIQANWDLINDSIHALAKRDKNIFVVKTSDLKDRGDKLHFDSPSQRTLGKRFAKEYADDVIK